MLLAWAERRDRGEADEEDLYDWWGKLCSPRRKEALPHGNDVLVLKSNTRTFLASTEAVFWSRRDAPAFDFSGPAVEYAKAVELPSSQ